MQKAKMVQFQELTIALVNTVKDVVKFKQDDNKLSTPDVIKVAFRNAEDLFKGVAGCEEIPNEIKQSTVEDWTHYVSVVTLAVDSPRAKEIAEQGAKTALEMKKLYDVIAQKD